MACRSFARGGPGPSWTIPPDNGPAGFVLTAGASGAASWASNGADNPSLQKLEVFAVTRVTTPIDVYAAFATLTGGFPNLSETTVYFGETPELETDQSISEVAVVLTGVNSSALGELGRKPTERQCGDKVGSIDHLSRKPRL